MTDSTSLDRLRTQVEYPESWRPEPWGHARRHGGRVVNVREN